MEWKPIYDFFMLNMFRNTDEELQNLGMTPDDIIRFRDFEKMQDSSVEVGKQNSKISSFL